MAVGAMAWMHYRSKNGAGFSFPNGRKGYKAVDGELNGVDTMDDEDIKWSDDEDDHPSSTRRGGSFEGSAARKTSQPKSALGRQAASEEGIDLDLL